MTRSVKMKCDKCNIKCKEICDVRDPKYEMFGGVQRKIVDAIKLYQCDKCKVIKAN